MGDRPGVSSKEPQLVVSPTASWGFAFAPMLLPGDFALRERLWSR